MSNYWEPELDTSLLEEIIEVLTSARETAENLRVNEELAARLRPDGAGGRAWLSKLHACAREITGSYREAWLSPEKLRRALDAIAPLPLAGVGAAVVLRMNGDREARRSVGAAAPSIAHPSLALALQLIGGAQTDDDLVSGMDALLDEEADYQARMRKLRELGKRGWYN